MTNRELWQEVVDYFRGEVWRDLGEALLAFLVLMLLYMLVHGFWDHGSSSAVEPEGYERDWLTGT